MVLPLIDYFSCGPQRFYTSCKPDWSRGNNDWVPSSPAKVKDYIELAELAIKNYDKGNHNDEFINCYLKTSPEMKYWRQAMGGKTPPALEQYQRENKWTEDVDEAINAFSATLTVGQQLYRGGYTHQGVQVKALSTTFSPVVAISEAMKGAQQQGVLQIYVLRVVSSRTHVYVYRQRGSKFGHEKEVVFASGATVGNINLARSGKLACGLSYEIIEAPIS